MGLLSKANGGGTASISRRPGVRLWNVPCRRRLRRQQSRRRRQGRRRQSGRRRALSSTWRCRRYRCSRAARGCCCTRTWPWRSRTPLSARRAPREAPSGRALRRSVAGSVITRTWWALTPAQPLTLVLALAVLQAACMTGARGERARARLRRRAARPCGTPARRTRCAAHRPVS